jgi:hypothetical protein
LSIAENRQSIEKEGEVFKGEIACRDSALLVARNSWKTPPPQEDDLPEEDAPNESRRETFMMVEVGIGDFVGVMTIARVGVLIYRGRYKGKEKSGSPVSYQSSSDEVREQGLIDGTE